MPEEITPANSDPQDTAATPTPTPPPVVTEPTDLDSYRRLVTKLRDEVKAAKADRTPQDEKDAKTISALKRQLESAPSPEDVQKEFAQKIGKALGLVSDEPVDPAELTKQLTATQAKAQQAALELAIFRSAPDAQVANALLDSRSFLAKIADLDPTDSAGISAAVTEAVESIPALGKRAPAPNPAQGSSASGPSTAGQLSAADVERMDWREIEKAREEGRLDGALGIKT